MFVIFVKQNAYFATVSTELALKSKFSFEHEPKQLSGKLVIADKSHNAVKDVQLKNALTPTLFIADIVPKDTKLEQPENESRPIDTQLTVKAMLCNFVHPRNAPWVTSVRLLSPSTVIRLVLYSNIYLESTVQYLGSMTFVMDEHCENML